MNFEIYENKFKGISIKYPRTWEVVERSPNPVVVFLSPVEGESDTIRENLNVILRNLPGMPFEEYLKKSMEGVSNNSENFKLIDNKIFNYHGVDAAEITFEALNSVDKKTMMKYHVFTTKVGHIAYDITYSAQLEQYETYLPLIKEMIDSFDII